MSVHPTTTTEEIIFVCDNINELANHYKDWERDYEYDPKTNEFVHKNTVHSEKEMVNGWFSV